MGTPILERVVFDSTKVSSRNWVLTVESRSDTVLVDSLWGVCDDCALCG